MANPNGRKGSSFERQVADYFRESWPDRGSAGFIDRRVKTGAKDKGDLANVRLGEHRVVVECKNSVEHRMNLSGWVDEAHTEADHDDAVVGIVVHKRKGRGHPGHQYVSMTVDDLVALVAAAREAGEGES